MDKRNNLTDQELLSGYLKAGSDRSLGILWQRHREYIYRSILFKVNNMQELAEDIVQDSFIKTKRYLDSGKYTEENNFRSLALKVAKNLAMDHHRSKHNSPSTPNPTGEFIEIWELTGGEDTSPQEKLIKQERSEHITRFMRKAVKSLPEVQQSIVNYRMVQDMPFKEIAEEQGISINTALGRMRYGLIEIRKYIEDNNIDAF